MCGVIGFFREDLGENEKKQTARHMLAQLQHRGPDGWGIYVAPNVALGHTRLSIIDKDGGAQPVSKGRYVMAYNGEVFNYLELRERLKGLGYRFITQSDTEVVLTCFEAYGVDAFEKFNGQFAILIWDRMENKLFAARDRYGIRPLYVLRHDESYYFASEMKAFDVLPGFERNYDVCLMHEHALMWNTLNNDTVYRHIETLMPGSYEIFSSGNRVVRKRFYNLGQSGDVFSGSYDEAKSQLRDLLEDSVKLRLRSDVDVGCYLSGGVDSSIIAHLANCQSDRTLKTYSVSFSDSQYDESEFQLLMSRQLDSQHHDLKVNSKMINDGFMEAVYHLERPIFRAAPVPLSLLSRQVNQGGAKAILTGEAADEILFGYDSFKEAKLLSFWGRCPESSFRPLLIKKLYPHLKHYADDKLYGLMKMYYERFLRRSGRSMPGLDIRLHNNKVIKAYIGKHHKVDSDEERIFCKAEQMIPKEYSDWSACRQQQFMEMNTLLSGYLLSSQGDRMSMSNSVEGRYPFLDHRLVEFAFSLPDKFKLKGFSQKHILRDAFKDVIPETIVNRAKLPYQAPDLKSFFNNGKLFGVSKEFLSPEAVESFQIFEPSMVKRLLKKYEMKSPDQIGYRDNMLMVFMLSTHVALHCARNKRQSPLPDNLCDVDFSDFNSTELCQEMR